MYIFVKMSHKSTLSYEEVQNARGVGREGGAGGGGRGELPIYGLCGCAAQIAPAKYMNGPIC